MLKGLAPVTCVVRLYFVMFLADLSLRKPWETLAVIQCWIYGKNANRGFYSELKVILLLYYIFMWLHKTRFSPVPSENRSEPQGINNVWYKILNADRIPYVHT